MRVALVVANYYPSIGGAEMFTQQVAENLVKGGSDADVITLCQDATLADTENINGVSVYRVRSVRAGLLSFAVNWLRLLRQVLKLDKNRHYDIVHSVAEGLPSQVGTSFKKLRKKPHLITIQGGQIARGFRKSLSGRVLQGLQRWSFRNANLVHTISSELERQAKRLEAGRTVVVPNGVDNGLFKPMDKENLKKELGLLNEGKTVVCVARLVPVKGIDCLIKAIPVAGQSIDGLRLLVIGEGAQRKELEDLIEQLNIQTRVRLLGSIPHHIIPKYINLADVFVLPSVHEGLGIALIEAMACGVPVIGSEVDGIVDIIEDGVNGLLFQPGNVADLAESMVTLLKDDKLREKFARTGLKTIKKKFLWETVLQKIDEAYYSLIRQ